MKRPIISDFHHFILYKPYGVLSQFTTERDKKTLKDLGLFPPSVYPVGRLDEESEGLLLLTDDNSLKTRLIDPKNKHPRTYLAQVERIPTEQALQQLRSGIDLGDFKSKPAAVHIATSLPFLPQRPVPIRFRKNVPTCWLEITLSEGKNRQVRRMTAAVGHPTLRLVRIKIATLSLGDLQPGESRPLSPDELKELYNTVNKKKD